MLLQQTYLKLILKPSLQNDYFYRKTVTNLEYEPNEQKPVNFSVNSQGFLIFEIFLYVPDEVTTKKC